MQSYVMYVDILLLIIFLVALFIVWFFYSNLQNVKKIEAEGKICNYCSAKLDANDSFCPNCGKEVKFNSKL